jgi:phosphodiesterase/alkaline phosphatase D-like protein
VTLKEGLVPGLSLVLGPLLRHVGARDATIWIEASAACRVDVLSDAGNAAADTFAVAGHHYAIVVLSGLEPGRSAAYEVRLGGVRAWPLPGSTYPPSLIRTIDPARPVRLMFGSCRSPAAVKVKDPTGSGHDVLGAYARRIAGLPAQDWPEALLMLGDQVYADETSLATQHFISARRDVNRPPYSQVANFEEYTHLYTEAWGDPDVRWLLSTMPTSMIFDDHDVLDDWNTSAAWRSEMQSTSWWEDRIIGAFMSYWIYQHLGNLSPEGLEADEMYRLARQAPDAEAALRAFAQRADREADGGPGTMWSYRRDYGPVRVLVIDSRAGRVLVEGHRSMVGEAEFAWIESQVEGGGFEHLIIGTSVPWLLPRALHDIESFDEAITAGSRGRTAARVGEKLRRAVDLEHWAAFRSSFDRLARLIVRVGTGAHGGPAPATICVLSGDVHHTYASEATFPDVVPARIFQLTCSPFHNSIPLPMRLVFILGWSRYAHRLTRWLARLGRVPELAFRWDTTAGPFFGNHLGLLTLDGRTAEFALKKSAFDGPTTRATPVPEASRDLTALPRTPTH